MTDDTEPTPGFEAPFEPVAASSDDPQPPTGVSGGYYRTLAIGALVLVVLCGAFMFLVSRDSGSDAGSDSDDTTYEDVEDSVPALTPEDLCVQELSDWMPWVTGLGSPMDAGAEWGMGSEEYQIIMGSWQTYNANLYKVGKDQASDMAYDAVANGCSNMTHDYIPGHQPPG